MAIEGIHKHSNQGIVVKNFPRPSPKIVEILQQTYSAFLLDFFGKLPVMKNVLPLTSGMKICGIATTALGEDLTVRRMAIDLAEPGDILIVATGGLSDRSCFGDGTATKMMLKGMQGVVIDGLTRDSAGIRKLEFPTFCRGVSPKNYHYPVSAEYGSVNVPVVCGGVLVRPGDIIMGDDDGIVVVSRDITLEKALEIEAYYKNEVKDRASMDKYVSFGAENILKKRGYQFFENEDTLE